MSNFKISISKRERRKVKKLLNDKSNSYKKELNNSFKKSAIKTVSASKKLAPVNEGVLRANIVVLKADANNINYEVGTEVKYARAIEFGRKPGTMPNIGAMERYARLKFGDESIGFAIAKKIEAEGTKPQPFLIPAFNKEVKELYKTLKKWT